MGLQCLPRVLLCLLYDSRPGCPHRPPPDLNLPQTRRSPTHQQLAVGAAFLSQAWPGSTVPDGDTAILVQLHCVSSGRAASPQATSPSSFSPMPSLSW
jgi:hypothetical protein